MPGLVPDSADGLGVRSGLLPFYYRQEDLIYGGYMEIDCASYLLGNLRCGFWNLAGMLLREGRWYILEEDILNHR